MIYGVALLAGCSFLGSFIGNLLGLLTGVDGDVGGVGFAMVLLLLATNSKKLSFLMPKGAEDGIKFWSEMFIPVIIAMAASQNVYKALSGGWMALIAGLATVVIALLLIPVFNKFTSKKAKNEEVEA